MIRQSITIIKPPEAMGRSKWINKKQANRKVRPAAQNPTQTKFRDLAKAKKPAGPMKSMQLTADNLAIHDALMGDAPVGEPATISVAKQQETGSQFSLSLGETELNRFKGFTDDKLSDAQTFATCFTNCTNASFGYFLQKFNSTSSVHKEMLSILAAATDILTQQKDEESDEKYFDLLVSSIYQAESDLALTANMILLYYVIKRMSADSLRQKFSAFQQLTSNLLEKYLNKSSISFIKFLLKSYCIFLREQDAQEWQNSLTRSSYVSNLLALTVHPKSRIRKAAKGCVVQLFNRIEQSAGESAAATMEHDAADRSSPESSHPIYEISTEFSRRKIKETSGEDITDALYTLNVWKEIVHLLPFAHLKSTCEQLIGLLALGNVLIFTSCMQILENLFKSNENGCRHMNADLNYKIILALYDNQPALSDHQPLLAWCSVTKYAELKLFALSKPLFTEHLLKLFGVYFNCLQSENQVLRSFAGQCINELLDRSIQAKDELNPSVFIAIGESLRAFLSYKHSGIWRLIFKLYSTFFKLTGAPFEETIKRSFAKLLELKNLDCEESKTLKFDYPIRSLLASQGVEFVLERVKLKPDFARHTLDNLWLIEILRAYVKNDKIANFNQHILVQAQKICPDLKQYTVHNDSPWLFAYVELWTLLPVFLDQPIDIKENLKTIARTMGEALTNAPPLRPFIMKALRQLIGRSKGDDLAEVAKYSKNYIPLLLNLYTSDVSNEKAMKTSIYQTLSMFFGINDPALTETIYGKVLENKEAELDVKKKGLYLDILRCVVCNLRNEEKLVQAFELGLQLSRNDKDKLEQKKAFRLIEELLKSPASYQVISDFYAKRNESFYESMVSYYSQNYSSVSIFAAQASFTRIIQHVISEQFKEQKLQPEEFQKFIPIIVGILQAKKSAKLSVSVFAVLNSCVDLMENGANRAISLLIECLNEQEQTIDRKATLIFVLHNLLLKYKDQIDTPTKSSLITNLLGNLSTENRKMVNVILLLLNDWFKLASKDEMLPYITNFISYLNSIKNPCAPQFKYKIKNIIEKILKKFGVEIVTKMLDDKYQRLVRVMLKNERREKNSKSNKRDAVDELDDDEDVGMDDEEIREFRKSKANKRWRFDEDEDFDGFHIFDTMETNEQANEESEVNSKQTNATSKKVSFNQVIRIDKEGQLMPDDEAAPDSAANKRKASSADSDSESSEDEEAVSKSRKKAQQKKSMREHIMNKYNRKRGIHRELGSTGTFSRMFLFLCQFLSLFFYFFTICPCLP